MDSAFKRSQGIFNKIQRQIKEKLSKIQQLDKKCAEYELELLQLREDYLQQLTQDQETLDDARKEPKSKDFGRIYELEKVLRVKSKQKVRLADQLDKVVSEAYRQVQEQLIESSERYLGRQNLKEQIKEHQMVQYGLAKHKGRQKNIPQSIKNIVQKYYNEQASTEPQQRLNLYCICPSDKVLMYPQDYVCCQYPQCVAEWYHFECVGLNKDDQLPEHWICPDCTIRNEQKKRMEQNILPDMFSFNYQYQILEFQRINKCRINENKMKSEQEDQIQPEICQNEPKNNGIDKLSKQLKAEYLNQVIKGQEEDQEQIKKHIISEQKDHQLIKIPQNKQQKVEQKKMLIKIQQPDNIQRGKQKKKRGRKRKNPQITV